MFKSSLWKILFLLPTLLPEAANFDIKVLFCRYKWGASNVKNSKDTTPGAYYWRDFYGVIPPDAYQLGPDNQNPQTYVGVVYDPSKNGTYPTTIVDRRDYVYSVFNGSVTKKTSYIQILCTRAPEKMIWMKLTQENWKTVKGKGSKLVRGGIHRKGQAPDYNYIVKTSKKGVTYIGSVTKFDVPMEYACLQGTLETTETFEWLTFKPNRTDEKTGKSMGRPFFSYRHKFKIQPNSIIPKFFDQVNIGPYSVTCTNEDLDKGKKFENNNTLLASLAYYWKPNAEFDLKDVIPAGNESTGTPLYIGQSFSSLNTYDVGSSNQFLACAHVDRNTYTETGYFHILSSNHQDKFEWVNTTSDTFSTLDKSRLIPGGQLDNGKRVFIGRTLMYGSMRPGSIKQSENGTYYINTMFGKSNDFYVLMFKNPK